MRTSYYSGLIAGLGFILGTLVLGSLLPDYNLVSQTVSEIGQKGSPLYKEYQILDLLVHGLLIVFSICMLHYAGNQGLNKLPAWFLMSFGLAGVGISLFASPHPLHNAFGISMTIGYCTPLVIALTWKQSEREFRVISLVVFLLILLGIILNLSPLFNPALYPLEYYGLVQRFLLFTFYLYCGYLSITMYRTSTT